MKSRISSLIGFILASVVGGRAAWFFWVGTLKDQGESWIVLMVLAVILIILPQKFKASIGKFFTVEMED